MRSGEELVPIGEDRLRTIFAEGQPDWLEEPARFSLTPQEVIDLLDTQTYFALLQRPYPTTQQAVIEHLRSERLIDQVDSTYSVRRFGALLLARRLTDFTDVSRKAVRVVVYKDRSKLGTKLDLTWESGYAVGFQPLVAFVLSQLPQNEVVEAIRTKVKLVPEIVIRELVANAIIHQDFTMTGASVMVEVYANRVEISNPGEPIVPVERFIDGYQSRNERLAELMRRMRICEEKSSGIDQVINAAETFQLPAPDFVVGHRRTSAIIRRSADSMRGCGHPDPYLETVCGRVRWVMGIDDEPEPAEAVPPSRREECDRVPNHHRDRGRGTNQARRSRGSVQKACPLFAPLGLSHLSAIPSRAAFVAQTLSCHTFPI